MKNCKYLLLFILSTQFLTLGFSQTIKPVTDTSTDEVKKVKKVKDAKKVHPAFISGYLKKEELPNSLLLLPPPPEEESVAFELDEYLATDYFQLVDEARKIQAIKDSRIIPQYPVDTILQAFNMVLDITISEKNTPNLYVLLFRSGLSGAESTSLAKEHYKRIRPFMYNNNYTCTPLEEEGLRQDGSYPSGHTALGWTWALILTEIFPDKTDELLVRGKEFGISRNVCNAHWHSDVQAGRMIASATVARLHANGEFMVDIAKAKKEVYQKLKK